MRDRQSTTRTDRIAVDEAFVCEHCGHRWYYTRSNCPNCRRDRVTTYTLGEGTLIAVTSVVMTPPDVRSPNPLGIARFGEVQVVGQLAQEAAVGDRVTFAGAYRLRDGDEETNPRLTVVTD